MKPKRPKIRVRDTIFNIFKNKKIQLLSLFLLAFLLRLVYLNQIRATPFFDSPVIDAKMYDDHAMEIVRGDWLGTKVFYHAPLYAYLLAFIYTIFGHNYYAVRIVQFFIGSLSCLLIYFIAKKIFNHKIGILASLIALTYGIFIFFEGELLRPFLIVFLSLLSILMLLWTVEKPNYKKWFVVGLILGFSAITRENILLFIPFVLFWIGIVFKGKKTRKQMLLYGMTFCLGIIIVIIPVTLRNYYVGKDLVLISSQGGLNFYIGNNPEANKTITLQPGAEWDELASLPARKGGLGKPSEQSNWFFSQAFRFIKREPLKWTGIMLKKFVFFLNAFEVTPNHDINFFKTHSPLLRMLLGKFWKIIYPFGIVCPLAFVGIVLCFKQWKKVLLLYLFIFTYMSSVILFHVRARYRVPVIPFLIIFGAYAIYWCFEIIKTKKYKFLIRPLLLFFVSFIVVNFNFYNIKKTSHLPIHFSLGTAYSFKGQYEKAVDEFKKAIEINPNYVNAYNNLGMAYEEMGLFDKAIVEYKKAIQLKPNYKRAHGNLGSVYGKKRLFDRAIAECKEAIEIDPAYADAHNNLGIAYINKGWVDQAMTEFKKAIELEPNHMNAHYNLGLVYLVKKMYREAVNEFKKAIRIDPTDIDARRRYEFAVQFLVSHGKRK